MMTTPNQDLDPYELLGVARDAGPDDIQAAWKRLMSQFHPDRNPGFVGEANEQTKRLNWVYDTLRDPDERARWERTAQHRANRPHEAQEQASGAHEAGTANAGGTQAPRIDNFVRCGQCLAAVQTAAAPGNLAKVRCTACGASFQALVAAQCVRHRPARRVGEDGSGARWMEYELHYRGAGHPMVRFEGPEGLRVERGEHFSLS